jgi:hypothetical protein
MNYFNKSKVNWNTWSPESIIFKSNQLVKKVLPPENALSWTSKSDRDQKMCKLTGGKAYQGYQGHSYHGNENYKGVMVQLKDLKSDYPSANIDFIDQTHRKNSVGENLGGLDILMYLNAFHTCWDYVQCPQTNQFAKKARTNHTPLEEGYRFCYGGQGDANSMNFEEFQELLQITEAIKTFLVEVVVPITRNELTPDEYELMVA